MNEILNQKFGVEVEMYNITRAKAAVVVKNTLEAWTGETWSIKGPGWHLNERKICKPFGGPDDMVWKIESDSSILACNDNERTELVSPVLTWYQMPVLQQIIRDLRAAGAKSDPAHQCGVHVHVDHKTAVTDNGLKSAEVYKIRIPADIPEAGQYLPPDQFACCGGYGYWTIQNDDQIVLGECQIEIERPADLKAVFQKHCKVTSWSDNRFGTTPHWRIGGE